MLPDFAAEGTGVHGHRAPNRTGNSGQSLQPGETVGWPATAGTGARACPPARRTTRVPRSVDAKFSLLGAAFDKLTHRHQIQISVPHQNIASTCPSARGVPPKLGAQAFRQVARGRRFHPATRRRRRSPPVRGLPRRSVVRLRMLGSWQDFAVAITLGLQPLLAHLPDIAGAQRQEQVPGLQDVRARASLTASKIFTK